MIYFLDTEFNEFGGDLISLALVREDGRSIYLVTDCKNPRPWVAENVMPILNSGGDPIRILPHLFGAGIAHFLHNDSDPLVIADWPDDIRYFCQALITGPGQMVAIPKIAFQILRVDTYPTTLQGAIQHNAWWDAMALRHLFLEGIHLSRRELAEGNAVAEAEAQSRGYPPHPKIAAQPPSPPSSGETDSTEGDAA